MRKGFLIYSLLLFTISLPVKGEEKKIYEQTFQFENIDYNFKLYKNNSNFYLGISIEEANGKVSSYTAKEATEGLNENLSELFFNSSFDRVIQTINPSFPLANDNYISFRKKFRESSLSKIIESKLSEMPVEEKIFDRILSRVEGEKRTAAILKIRKSAKITPVVDSKYDVIIKQLNEINKSVKNALRYDVRDVKKSLSGLKKLIANLATRQDVNCIKDYSIKSKMINDSIVHYYRAAIESVNSDSIKQYTDLAFKKLNELSETIDKWLKCIKLPDENSENEQKEIEIRNATITFSQNLIDQIDLIVTLNGKELKLISNQNWAISLRNLIDKDEAIKFEHREGKLYWLKFKDVFDVYPVHDAGETSTITYYAKDGTYFFSNESPLFTTKKITAKGFSDYLTATIFIDPFGVTDNQPNKLVQTEFSLEVPINYRKYSRLSLFNNVQLRSSLGTNIGDFKGNTKLLQAFPDTISRIGYGSDTLRSSPSRYVVNNFDLIRYNWLHTILKANIGSFYCKEMNTKVILESGINFWLTSVEKKFKNQISSDSTSASIKKNVISYSPELTLKFLFTPKLGFGANLNISYLWSMRPLDEDIYPVYGKKITPAIDIDSESAKQNRRLLRVEFNAYFKVKNEKSNDGIFTRLQFYRNLGDINTHFLLLIGYSTNVSSLIKK